MRVRELQVAHLRRSYLRRSLRYLRKRCLLRRMRTAVARTTGEQCALCRGRVLCKARQGSRGGSQQAITPEYTQAQRQALRPAAGRRLVAGHTA